MFGIKKKIVEILQYAKTDAWKNANRAQSNNNKIAYERHMMCFLMFAYLEDAIQHS